MVCVVCNCCATSPYGEVCIGLRGRIGSDGETLCHDIYPARPITTVSVAANTICMMDGPSSLRTSEYAVSSPACTNKSPEPAVERKPPEPGSHTGQVHCSE